ncbi:MAG: glycoside hydrolase family 2 TIM barrel-domain containing protein [Chitinophagaceae bacterium]
MKQLYVFLAFLLFANIHSVRSQGASVWTAESANDWYSKQPFYVGANFLPSSAINQLEMWQAESFDAETISKELGWASSIGMNVMRVYLHDLAWQIDPAGFKKRMADFLAIAAKHKIKILFTVFDDCWNPDAYPGKQPNPKPGIHNSGWVRSPNIAVHDNPMRWNHLEAYVKDVLSTFKDDTRILMWDLYNEPGNSGYGLGSMELLKRTFEWAWFVRPSQPLTTGTWYDNKDFNDFAIANSDVISFHNYNDAQNLEKEILEKMKFGKPLICTEYMARTRNSTFQTCLPIFKKYKVAAINWGLVAGKSNTIYQWSKPIPDGSEPELWFHDVFRKDGSPYKKEEIDAIKAATGKK